MPEEIPSLPDNFVADLSKQSFQEISFTTGYPFFQEEIPENLFREIVDEAINFTAPVVRIKNNISTLELFHGPTLAFKDFGARFMARVMSYFVQDMDQPLTILVATSGDTGSAVAHGFYQVPGIRVFILYPKNKVSNIQEKQFTTLAHNITALEIAGNFDDCQRMVKSAFVDPDLNETRIRESRLYSQSPAAITGISPAVSWPNRWDSRWPNLLLLPTPMT